MKPSTKPRVQFLAFCAFLFWVSLYVYMPILPSLIERLGGSFRTIGLIVGSYGLVQFLLRVPTGLISDKIGRRKPFVVAGFAISALSALGMGYSLNPVTLGCFRSVSGLAATMWVPFTVMFSSFYGPDATAAAMGHVNFCMSMGHMTGTLLGGWLAEVYGLRVPFFMAGLIGIAGGLAVLPISEKPLAKQTLPLFSQIGRLSGVKVLLTASILGALCQYGAWVTVYGFTPVYAERLGASEFQLGILTLLALLPQALAALAIGKMAKHFNPWSIVVLGFIVSGVCVAALPLFPSLHPLYVFQVIAGFARGLVMPALMSLAIDAVDISQRATAMGVFQAVYAAGMFLGPALSGFLGGWYGLTGIFVSTGILTILSAGIGLFGPRLSSRSA